MIFEENRGSREGHFKPRRPGHRPRAIVVHTTGYGPIRRWKNPARGRTFETPFDAALFIYGRIMKPGAHYLVGQAGEAVQTADVGLAAWHVGGKGGRAYKRPPRAAWWAEAWPGLRSPVDLAGGRLWDGWSANLNTIGIEVVPPADDPRGLWSPRCKAALDSLIVSLCDEHAIPHAREYVFTHSDAHPHDRTRRGRPWDTSAEVWADFLESHPLAA